MKILIATVLMIVATILVGNFAYPDDESGISKTLTIIMMWMAFIAITIGYSLFKAFVPNKNSAGKFDMALPKTTSKDAILRDVIGAIGLAVIGIIYMLFADIQGNFFYGIIGLLFALAAMRFYAYYSVSKNQQNSLASDRGQALLTILVFVLLFVFLKLV